MEEIEVEGKRGDFMAVVTRDRAKASFTLAMVAARKRMRL
jgi:hypothetical protein